MDVCFVVEIKEEETMLIGDLAPTVSCNFSVLVLAVLKEESTEDALLCAELHGVSIVMAGCRSSAL